MVRLNMAIPSLILVVIITACSCKPVRNKTEIPPYFELDVDSFVSNIFDCRDILGLSLTVVRGNETIITKGYGHKDTERTQRVNEHTLFGIASLTKSFTATLLGKVLKKHGYTWDSTVRTVLADHGIDFRLHDAMRTDHVTLRDIAAHRTGIPKHNYMRMQRPTRAEMVRKLRYFKATHQFRDSYLYNNLMYGLMTYVTETLEGRTWETLLTSNIFQPLSMENTTFTHVTDVYREDLAHPVLRNETGGWREVNLQFHSSWGELGGSGSVTTNAVDMAKWLKLQLNGGRAEDGSTIIDKDVLEETHQPNNIIKPEPSYMRLYRKPGIPVTMTLDTYALGWRRGYYRGLRFSLHTGTSWGYGGIQLILHDMDIAMFIGITGRDRDYTGRYTLCMYIIDLLLGYEPWIHPLIACDFPQPWINVEQTPAPNATDSESARGEAEEVHSAVPLVSFCGTYGNFGYGQITVLETPDNKLQLRYGDYGCWELTYLGNGRFRGEGIMHMWMRALAWVQFKQHQGRIVMVEIPLEKLDPVVFVRDLDMSDAPDADK